MHMLQPVYRHWNYVSIAALLVVLTGTTGL